MSRLRDAILAVGRALDRAFGWETPPARLTEAEGASDCPGHGGGAGLAVERAGLGGIHSRGPSGRGWVANHDECQRHGGNVNIVISDDTGAVVQKGFAPY